MIKLQLQFFADTFDGITLGDLCSEKFLEQGANRAGSLGNIYSANPRTDLTAQSPGVKNAGPTDDSDVFEIVKFGSGGSVDITTLAKEDTLADVLTEVTGVTKEATQLTIKTAIDNTNLIGTSTNTKLDDNNVLTTSSNTKLDTIITNTGTGAKDTTLVSTNSKLDAGNTNTGAISTKMDTNNTLTTSSNTKLDTIITNTTGTNNRLDATNTTATAIRSQNNKLIDALSANTNWFVPNISRTINGVTYVFMAPLAGKVVIPNIKFQFSNTSTGTIIGEATLQYILSRVNTATGFTSDILKNGDTLVDDPSLMSYGTGTSTQTTPPVISGRTTILSGGQYVLNPADSDLYVEYGNRLKLTPLPAGQYYELRIITNAPDANTTYAVSTTLSFYEQANF